MGYDSLRISIDLMSTLVLRSVAYHSRQLQQVERVSTDPPYRTDLINAAMGAHRLTNKTVAKRAGVGVMTVSKIRNGYPRVGYATLKKVVEALGLTIAEVSKPRAA